jgi:predicted porin
MKKNMIALAVATAFAAPAVMADATMYGQMNMWMTKTDEANAAMSVESYATKFGIKGSNDLGNGLKAIYGLEFQVDAANNGKTSASLTGGDTEAAEDYADEVFNEVMDNELDEGTEESVAYGIANNAAWNAYNQVMLETMELKNSSTAITNRNMFVGIAGGFGTVMLGHMDSPMKSAMGKVAIMEDTAGDMSYGIAKIAGEDRIVQSVTYVSPKFEGVQVALQSGENDATDTTENSTSWSVSYTGMKDLIVGIAGDKNVDKDDEKRTALTAQYKMDNMVFGLIREQVKLDGAKDKTTTLVNGAYTMDKTTFALSYRTYAEDGSSHDGDKDITVAAVYGFNKSTSAWVGVKKMDYSASATEDVQAVQLGLRTKF